MRVCVYFTFISSVFTPEQHFKEMIRKQEQKRKMGEGEYDSDKLFILALMRYLLD